MFISGDFHVLGMRKLHFQCNTNREVATTSPRFCNEAHPLHVLFVKVVPGTRRKSVAYSTKVLGLFKNITQWKQANENVGLRYAPTDYA